MGSREALQQMVQQPPLWLRSDPLRPPELAPAPLAESTDDQLLVRTSNEIPRARVTSEAVLPTLVLPESGTLLLLGLGLAGVARLLRRGKTP